MIRNQKKEMEVEGILTFCLYKEELSLPSLFYIFPSFNSQPTTSRSLHYPVPKALIIIVDFNLLYIYYLDDNLITTFLNKVIA